MPSGRQYFTYQAESPASASASTSATDGRNSGQQDPFDWDSLFDGDIGEDASFFDDNYNNYNSLVLPPINSNNQNNFNDDLPSFDNAVYFDALPHLPSHDQERSATSSANAQLPPSNHQASIHRPPVSQYRVAASIESPNSFDDYLELTPSPPSMPPTRNVATRSSSIVDLTESSPGISRSEVAPATKKRKRDSPGVAKASKATRPGSSRASVKVEDLSKVDLVDLSAIDNDEQYNEHKAKEEALKAKQQADLIREQNQAEANKPVRLAEFQCIICMDNPTDLTVTHCGT